MENRFIDQSIIDEFNEMYAESISMINSGLIATALAAHVTEDKLSMLDLVNRNIHMVNISTLDFIPEHNRLIDNYHEAVKVIDNDFDALVTYSEYVGFSGKAISDYVNDPLNQEKFTQSETEFMQRLGEANLAIHESAKRAIEIVKSSKLN